MGSNYSLYHDTPTDPCLPTKGQQPLLSHAPAHRNVVLKKKRQLKSTMARQRWDMLVAGVRALYVPHRLSNLAKTNPTNDDGPSTTHTPPHTSTQKHTQPLTPKESK